MSNARIVREMYIKNQMGLHARPAAQIVQAVGGLNCEISIEKDGEEVDGKSIMGVMMLAAEYGSKIVVTTQGPDAKQAIGEIARIVEDELTEEYT